MTMESRGIKVIGIPEDKAFRIMAFQLGISGTSVKNFIELVPVIDIEFKIDGVKMFATMLASKDIVSKISRNSYIKSKKMFKFTGSLLHPVIITPKQYVEFGVTLISIKPLPKNIDLSCFLVGNVEI